MLDRREDISVSGQNHQPEEINKSAEPIIPLIDYCNELPQGKISKQAIRKPLKKQVGFTCTLYAMRRIAFFNTKEDKTIQAYKALKQGLASFNPSSAHCYLNLIGIGNKLVKEFNINLEQALEENLSYMNAYYQHRKRIGSALSPVETYRRSTGFIQWITLYSILVQKILQPLFNLKQAEWHPAQGIVALEKSLKTKGAHFFIGKFGTWCYNQKPEEFKAECTPTRQIMYFKKDSFQADSASFTHGILVDQIKNIKGKDMVFYRDPNFASKPGAREKIFMISYENFVNRITDLRGLRYSLNECSENESFGLVSSVPEKIYSSSL